MNKIVNIKYNKSFLELANKIVKNDNIIISRCNDIHPWMRGPIFINCKTVFFEKCDENMIFYWMNKFTFPNVCDIYLLDSNPPDSNFFSRFYDTKIEIYLTEDYSRYKNRLAQENDNVFVLNCNQMTKLINNYIEEDVITINRN